MNSNTVETTARRRPLQWLLRQAEHVLALLAVCVIVYWTCFDLVQITSDSMAPTLRGRDWKNGDLVLVERVSHWFRCPKRWEVISFISKDGQLMAKRVVGLPGERVQLRRDGRLLIDGRPTEIPAELRFLRYFAYGNLIEEKSASCGDGYFVLGDDSRDSDDSRFLGPVFSEQLIGRTWLILAPGERRGVIR